MDLHCLTKKSSESQRNKYKNQEISIKSSFYYYYPYFFKINKYYFKNIIKKQLIQLGQWRKRSLKKGLINPLPKINYSISSRMYFFIIVRLYDQTY